MDFISLILPDKNIEFLDFFSFLQVISCLNDVRESVLVGLISCGLGGSLADSDLYPRLADAALGAGLETQLAAQLEKEGHQPLAVALQVPVTQKIFMRKEKAR